MRSRGNQVVESKNGVLDRGGVVHVTRGGCVKHVVASRGARIHVRHGGPLRRRVCVAGKKTILGEESHQLRAGEGGTLIPSMKAWSATVPCSPVPGRGRNANPVNDSSVCDSAARSRGRLIVII